MNAQQQIIAKLNEMFAPLDADVLENSQKWAARRIEALAAFKTSEEYQLIRRDAYKLYARLFDIAGGKTWYGVFNSGRAATAEFVEKNCAAIAEKRNASITKKLAKANVTEIIEEVFTSTSDGFNGVFVVMTDAGKKCVKIDTIIAGGYNIQCRHMRTLINVK